MNFGRIFNYLSIMIFSLSFIYATCPDGTEVCLSLDGGNLNYESTVDVAGFQFSHNGCVTGASGGDATTAGFMISASETAVIGFSLSGSVVSAGSGTLVELAGVVTEECMFDFIFSDSAGQALAVDFSEACSQLSWLRALNI